MIRTRNSVLLRDNVRQEQESLGIEMVGEEALSWLGVPLMFGDQVLGVMAVQSHTTPRLYDEHSREILTAIGSQVAIAIHNAKQFEATETALTEVQQSQDLLSSIIDATPDWIFVKDKDYRYQLVNRGYAEALNIAPADFIGKSDIELGLSEEIAQGDSGRGVQGFWTQDRDVIESGEPVVNPAASVMINGVTHIYHYLGTPLGDEYGNVWGVLGMGRDVTEREQLLASSESLYRASADLNVVQSYDGIVDVLRRYTLLGHGSQTVLLAYFDAPWTNDRKPEEIEVLVRWMETPLEGFSPYKYRLEDFPSVEELMKPDRPVVVEDVSNDPNISEVNRSMLLDRFNAQSTIFTPLVVGGQWIGYVNATYNQLTSFPEPEMRQLAALTGQAAVAVQSIRRLDETERRARREQTIREITENLRSATNLDDLVETVTTELGQYFSAKYAMVELGITEDQAATENDSSQNGKHT
jgi:PAS domain S-box-containing protein